MNESASDGLIAGRYRVGELLGTGGSASVFSATDVRGGGVVALKLLHPHLATDLDAREALLREARAARDVRHPNLVGALDAGIHDAHNHAVAWIALELAPGVSLAEYVELRGALDAPQALAVATGVLRALEAVHAAGLVHRDISPANVMVAPTGDKPISADDVRLVDFGLADAPRGPGAESPILDSAGSGEPTTVVGNASYMSPEQAVGAAVDARGDLYQLGAVLYLAITARPPFERATAAQTMQAHVSAPPPVPSVRRPGIPRALDRLVVKSLLKEPDDRYASATEMLAAVEGLALAGSLAQAGSLASAGSRAHADALSPVPAPESRTRLLPAARAPRVTHAATSATTSTTAAATIDARDDTTWRWKLGLAIIVIGALVAWIVTSATSAAPPEVALPSATAEATTAPVVAPARPPAVALVAVPATAGMALDAARATLEGAGFVVGATSEQLSPAPAGSIVATVPEGGANVAPGAQVDLVQASGSNLIPTAVGLTRDAAIAAIQSAGFGVFLTVTPDASVTPGTVLSTDPASGSQLAVGRAVTITVASSPAPTATPSATPSATPGAGDGE